ncbi:hypothetical protein CHS0354_042169 [Potamilus streckersoni]|uniref:Uncharacterized protein n=1 Tax=Potamilus streckersoni TaxID=2493646 RepID=A0AAE0TNT3_9BIVA|nr:hypothetical protein CHS0354_042169 [Potamilus streckersoni]
MGITKGQGMCALTALECSRTNSLIMLKSKSLGEEDESYRNFEGKNQIVETQKKKHNEQKERENAKIEWAIYADPVGEQSDGDTTRRIFPTNAIIINTSHSSREKQKWKAARKKLFHKPDSNQEVTARNKLVNMPCRSQRKRALRTYGADQQRREPSSKTSKHQSTSARQWSEAKREKIRTKGERDSGGNQKTGCRKEKTGPSSHSNCAMAG